jgi:hypothetical protein
VSSHREAAAHFTPATQLPEAGRCWIRYSPRAWAWSPRLWVHLAQARIGEPRRAVVASPADALDGTLDDVVYLPPVDEPERPARDSVAAAHVAHGTPVLLHQFSEERAPSFPGVVRVLDLLEPLLAKDLESLRRLPRELHVVWPLLPGLTDGESLWREGCERLAEAGIRGVQGVAPVLTPGDRRQLDERSGGEAFDALFHRPAPSEQDFARYAARYGLAPFLERPLPRSPLRGAANRKAAGALALAAEYATRLGRPVDLAQALFRAARWVDQTTYDIEAMARDGHLEMVSALDDESRRLLRSCFEGEEPQILTELRDDYLGSHDSSPSTAASRGAAADP